MVACNLIYDFKMRASNKSSDNETGTTREASVKAWIIGAPAQAPGRMNR
jgi:hypothetical protein